MKAITNRRRNNAWHKTFPFGIRNFYVADPEGNLLEIGSWGKEE